MFSIWLSSVLDPQCPSLSWETAARIQWTKALNINNPSTHTALFSYFQTHPVLHGPHNMTGFWRQVTSAYREAKFSISVATISNGRGFPRKEFTVSQNVPEQSSDPAIPRSFSLFPSQPSFNLKQIWLDCHTPFVPPKWNAHCWKVLQSAYRTAERINIPLNCNYCGFPNTLIHRYFKCSAAQPVWNSLNVIFPSAFLTQENQVNWVYQISSSFVDQDFRAIMFITALWSIHTAFLEAMINSHSYAALPLLRLATNVSTIFGNIYFGTNWPPVLKNRIKSWPSPWFLHVSQINQSVNFCPCPPPHTLSSEVPDPTDHPPDASTLR